MGPLLCLAGTAAETCYLFPGNDVRCTRYPENSSSDRTTFVYQTRKYLTSPPSGLIHATPVNKFVPEGLGGIAVMAMPEPDGAGDGDRESDSDARAEDGDRERDGGIGGGDEDARWPCGGSGFSGIKLKLLCI